MPLLHYWRRSRRGCCCMLGACKSKPHIFIAWEPLLVLLKKACDLAVVALVQGVHRSLLNLLTRAKFTQFCKVLCCFSAS
jgi:hypothetical protein